jgi:hypothetical protein
MHGRAAGGIGRALLSIPVLVFVVATGVAVPPAGAATSVTNTGICFGYPAAGGCRYGYGGTTTASPGSTLALDAALTATTGVSSGQQVVIDASGTGVTFSGNHSDYQVNNDTTLTGCPVASVALSNSSQTVSVTMPSGCAGGFGAKIVVLAGNAVMPSTAGSFSLSLHTTNDSTPVGTNSLDLFTVPSAPKNLVAARGNVSLGLSWDPPDNSGGTTLSAYDAYCVPAPSIPDTGATPSATTDGSTTSTTVTGLSAHETFNCVVTAVNSVGQSDASNVASAAPYQIPSPPVNFDATRGNASATLTWQTPTDVGGTPITAYNAYCSTAVPPIDDPSDLCGTFGPGKRTGVVTGLTNGVSYFIGLTAQNAAGESPMNGPVIVTPATVPSHPRRLRVIPETGSLLLKWKVPASDGGDPITQYKVLCQTSPPPFVGSPAYFATTTHLRVRRLTSGAEYWCTVFALNTVGTSKESTVVTGTPA